MDYLNFELEIAAGSGSEYPVTVMRSPAGEAHETMHFPFDEQALKNQLATLQNVLLSPSGASPQSPSAGKQTIQDFGQALFEALFTGKVHDLYVASWSEAIMQGKGLRVKLRIQPAELAALPWEFLYDPSQARYLCLSDTTPVVRYFELPEPFQPLSVTLPLSILGVAASPKNLADLDVEREKQRIEKALAGLQAKGLAKLTWLPGRTWEDVQQAMLGGPWHIFHFIGHGGFDPHTNEGEIVLEDSAGQARYLSAAQLVLLLTDHFPLRLVVLNSCEGAQGSTRDIFSSTAATLVREGIPAVLANQYAITDQAAIELSRAFYEALAAGMPVDTAIGEARKAITLSGVNTVEWGTPVLSMHTPDGVLFDLPQTPSTFSSTLDAVPPGTNPAQPPSSQLPPSLTTPATPLIPTPSGAPIPVLKSQQLEKFALEAKPSNDVTTIKPFNPILYIGLAVLIIVLIVGSVGLIVAQQIATSKVRTPGVTATTISQRVANATATAAGDPYPPHTGMLILNDPLQDNTAGYQWNEGKQPGLGNGVCSFSDGAYHLSHSGKGNAFVYCGPQANGLVLSNLAFEANLTIIQGDYAGIWVRFDKIQKTRYLFYCDTNGDCYLGTDDNDAVFTVRYYRPVALRSVPQTNLLAIVAIDDTLSLYVNNQFIGSVKDTSYQQGQVGVFAQGRNGSFDVIASDVRLWKL